MKYHRGHGRHYGHRHPGMRRPGAQVSIREMDDRYEIYLIAVGRTREDFRLDIANDVLTIHASAPASSEEEGQWQKREFRFRDFERSFQLSDKINSEAISASYDAGILTIVLPKHEDKVTQRREVTVE
ncbi:MAG: Hsp20/alpha crystallin family protein [Bacteroidota bacterium]